jgi:hypothetical protein
VCVCVSELDSAAQLGISTTCLAAAAVAHISSQCIGALPAVRVKVENQIENFQGPRERARALNQAVGRCPAIAFY